MWMWFCFLKFTAVPFKLHSLRVLFWVFFFHALLSIQLTFVAQDHPKNADGVYICQKSSERLTNANPLAGLKVLLSSGYDQMIPVHVTKPSSRRSDSCTKSYLTSKIPSAPGSCSLLMKIQLCEPDVRRSLEKLPSWCCLMWSSRLMIDDELRGGWDVPESIK